MEEPSKSEENEETEEQIEFFTPGLVARGWGFVTGPLSLSWSDLRILGTSSILKSSYFWFLFVPVAAKLFLQIRQPLKFELFGQLHSVELQLPFSWYLFYFAAVAFAAATGLFSLFCPKMIKLFNNFREFYDQSNGARTLFKFFNALPPLTKTNCQEFLKWDVKNAWDVSNSRGQGNEVPITVNQIYRKLVQVKREEMSDSFQTIYHYSDISRRHVRIIIALFYVAGFLLILWIAGESFMSVVKMAWSA